MSLMALLLSNASSNLNKPQTLFATN